VITVVPGKHRRPRRRDVASADLPAASQSTLLTDALVPPYAVGPRAQEAQSPLLHPDHPSAPVPRVRAPVASRSAGAGRGPARGSSLGAPRSRPNSEPSRVNGRRQGEADAQTRSSLIAPDRAAQLPGTAGAPRQPGFGHGGQAAPTRQEALNLTATVPQAVEQDAKPIRQEATAAREPTEKEAAHLRAVILSLSEQLSQMSAYITANLVLPGALTAMPAPATAPEPTPTIAPPKPGTRPGAPAARPTRAGTTPAKQPQGRPRQFQAMRIATVATAGLFSVAAITGAAEIGMHGFKFFTFRQGGAGETAGTQTDQQFLAQQAAAARAAQAPHVPGKHSAKSTSG
jgi:hypothetical protein